MAPVQLCCAGCEPGSPEVVQEVLGTPVCGLCPGLASCSSQHSSVSLARCDADPSALANYVVALVKKDKPEKELKAFCADQLDVFLQKGVVAMAVLVGGGRVMRLSSKSFLVAMNISYRV